MRDKQSINYERFLTLYSVSQKRIFAYILSLVPKRVDAEDMLQQTSMEMWRMFDKFEPGTDFTAWGIAISRFRIMKFRKEQQRDRKVTFLNDEAFEIILDKAAHLEKGTHYQLPALEGCIKRLNDRDRRLLVQRYDKGLTFQSIADKLGCSVTLVYRNMTLIHTNLLRCIRRTVSMWDAL